MKILITGITGFIGFALAKKLISQNHQVFGFIRQSSKKEKLEKLEIPYFTGELSDIESIKKALPGMDTIIHCAGFVSDWGKKEQFINGNVLATENLMKACLEIKPKRIIHFSTVDVFGHKHNSLINEKSPYGKQSDWYGKTKIMAEKTVRNYIDSKTLPISIVYPSWVYGEGDTHLIPEIVPAILNKSMLFMRNKGRHVIELNYIGNLTDAVCHLISHPETTYGRYILSDEPQVLFKDFVNEIAHCIGKNKVRLFLPYFLSYTAGFMMEILWKLLRIKRRPLLTRHAVALLGNNILYSIDNLKSTGFQQRYFYPDTVKTAVNDYLTHHKTSHGD